MVKIDGVAQMLVILTIAEMSCLVASLYEDLMCPVYLCTLVTLRSLPALFALIRP